LLFVTNALNFIDGLNGLAAGVALIAAGFLAGIAATHDGWFAYAASLLLVAGLAGFLPFNFPRARIFMGDVGSLSLGGVIAVISLITKKEILILVIGGVFVLEIASVIIQVVSFKLRKKRVFKMAPLHHHYELIGWPETKTVIRFWILGGLFAIIALSTLKIQ
jgi:phospho-N-acetylmuramoyl-pentapeptide-transferase